MNRVRAVFLGLGSNVGDRRARISGALQALAAVPGVRVERVSQLRETTLVGDGPPQGPFLNGVAELATTLPPHALLAVLKQLEADAGRALPAPPNHPRPLDLDILFHGSESVDTKDLVVPHPRWHEREFVVAPLRELGVDVDAMPRREAARVATTAGELVAACARWLAGGCVVGLVPTMGALHDGHASLLRAARRECDRVVATVFVNPLQFGPREDFAAYPRTLDADREICRRAGVDVLFAPPVAEMFDPEFCSHVGVGRAAQGMEGALRPGHFRGVATVVARLFALARPHRAYFGEKDAQQLAVIRRMVQDLGFPLQVVACPIVREPDGLAMSSRNVYLTGADRAAAPVLHRALASAREQFRRGRRDRDELIGRVRAVLATEPAASVDYVELRREGDLAPLPAGEVAGGRLLVAARFTRGARPVRLLDNLSLDSSLDALPGGSASDA